jgi:hypothetical protein
MADILPEHYLELENAETAALSSQVSRRSFLRWAGGMAAGATIATSGTFMALRMDTEIGDALYGGGEPEIGLIADVKAEQKFPHHFNIVGGGFGVHDIEGLAEHVHEGLGHFGQTAYIKNSNGGLYVEKQKRNLLEFLEDHGGEVVNLYGHSMDGMTMTEIGCFLMQNGVEVQSKFLDCTPEKKYDVRPDKLQGAEFLAAVDRYSELLDISGGPVSRLVMESASRVLEGRVDYWHIVKEALAKLHPENASNKLLEDQAHYMCAFNGAEWGPQYPRRTVIGKLRPQNWNADPTINNQTALVGWRVDAFPQLAVHDVAVKGGGHANPGAAGAEYTKTLVRFGTEQDLYQAKWGLQAQVSFLTDSDRSRHLGCNCRHAAL